MLRYLESINKILNTPFFPVLIWCILIFLAIGWRKIVSKGYVSNSIALVLCFFVWIAVSRLGIGIASKRYAVVLVPLSILLASGSCCYFEKNFPQFSWRSLVLIPVLIIGVTGMLWPIFHVDKLPRVLAVSDKIRTELSMAKAPGYCDLSSQYRRFFYYAKLNNLSNLNDASCPEDAFPQTLNKMLQYCDIVTVSLKESQLPVFRAAADQLPKYVKILPMERFKEKRSQDILVIIIDNRLAPVFGTADSHSLQVDSPGVIYFENFNSPEFKKASYVRSDIAASPDEQPFCASIAIESPKPYSEPQKLNILLRQNPLEKAGEYVLFLEQGAFNSEVKRRFPPEPLQVVSDFSGTAGSQLTLVVYLIKNGTIKIESFPFAVSLCNEEIRHAAVTLPDYRGKADYLILRFAVKGQIELDNLCVVSPQ